MPQAEPHIQRTSIPDILTKRSDFVVASKRGDKGVAFSVIVQKRDRDDTAPARYGITASRSATLLFETAPSAACVKLFVMC